MSERSTPHCLKPGSCLDANGNSLSTCPSDREQSRYVETTPLLTAESLCISGIMAYGESRNKRILVDNFESICFDLDRALAIPRLHGDNFKNQLFTQIGLLRAEAQPPGDNLDSISPSISLQLHRLGIFLSAFKSRSSEQTPSRDLIEQTHRGLCDYIERLDTRFMQQAHGNNNLKKIISAHKAENEAMALLTRLGRPDVFPYPALAREEASHARGQHNHDFYTISGKKKSPVQVKTSASGKKYSRVAVIQQYDILRAMKRDPASHQVDWNPPQGHEDFEWPNPYRYEQILAGEAPDPLAELLVEEAKLGNRLSKDKKNALALASSYVLSRLI